MIINRFRRNSGAIQTEVEVSREQAFELLQKLAEALQLSTKYNISQSTVVLATTNIDNEEGKENSYPAVFSFLVRKED